MEEKASRSGNKYYEVILDWFRQQIPVRTDERRRSDSVRAGTGFSVWCQPGSGAEALRILEYIGIINNGRMV